MQTVAAATITALSAQGRTFTPKLLVDWNGNGLFDHSLSDLSAYVLDFDTDRALATALATGVQGFVVGELKSSLSADAGVLLSPWRTDQPRYRLARTGFTVQASVVIAGETVRQFTGILRGLSVDSGGAVTLTAYDPVDPLYRPVAVPTVVGRDAPPPYVIQPGLTPYWVISHALDQVGLPLGPKPMTGPVLTATMHGSAAPNLGFLWSAEQTQQGRAVAQPCSFGDGQQGTPALLSGPTAGYDNDQVTAEYVLSSPINMASVNATTRIVFDVRFATGTFMGAGVELRAPAGSPNIGPHVIVRVYRDITQVFVYRTKGGTFVQQDFVTAITTDTWHRVALDFKYMTTTSVRVRRQVDNGTLASATVVIPTVPAGNNRSTVDNALFYLTNNRVTSSAARTADAIRLQHLHVGIGEIAADVWAAWAPSADVTTDMAPLTVTPQHVGSAFDLLTELAEAEQAAHGFSEFGRYFYKSRSKWRTYSSVADVTSSDALTGLSVDESQERAARTVVVPHYRPAPSVIEAFSLSSALRVRAGSTQRLTVRLEEPIVRAPAMVYAGFNVAENLVMSAYAANSMPDGSGAEMGIQVGVTLRGSEADLVLVNQAGYDAYMVGPFTWRDTPPSGNPAYEPYGGSPALVIRGVAAALGDEFRVSREDASSPSQSTHTAPSNGWRQGETSTDRLLLDLQSELHHPPATLENVDTVGDPRLQLCDCVRLVDPVTGVDDPAHIVGLRSRFAGGGCWQSLAVQMVGPPGSWLIGVTGRSEIGVSTYA